jgi:uncharacterized protein
MKTKKEIVQNSYTVSNFSGDGLATFNQWTEKSQNMRFSECNRCGDCLPVCPEKIEIPKIFRIYEQYNSYGMTETARYKYRKLEKNVTDCTLCNKCALICHSAVNLPSILREIDKVLS